jgi:hypothetical protein
MTTGNTLAGLQSNLGQALGQGYANIGNIQAQQAMGPINALSSLGGQAIQAAAMAYGGGLGGGLSSMFSSAAPSFTGNAPQATGYYSFGGQQVPYVYSRR